MFNNCFSKGLVIGLILLLVGITIELDFSLNLYKVNVVKIKSC
jgi:hypothetical protein